MIFAASILASFASYGARQWARQRGNRLVWIGAVAVEALTWVALIKG